MLFAALTLALALGQPEQAPQPTAEQVQEARTWLRQAFLDAADQVDEFKQKTKERFDLFHPVVGLQLETLELAVEGSDKPLGRITRVIGVYAGSYADKAGIKPGDRIAAINDEELDHESGKAVLLYLSNLSEEGGVIWLTLERDGVRRKVSVVHAPIPCTQTISDRFREAEWLAEWDKSQKALLGEAKLLENTVVTLDSLEKSRKAYETQMLRWASAFAVLDRELDWTGEPTCVVIR